MRTRMGRVRLVVVAVCAWASAIVAGTARAQDLTALSLEELMALDVTVTSPARRPQRLGDTTSATFVLTGADLRQAGVWTIPDALRLVPGVQVARIDASKWAVSIRGFNNRFSDKALVLIDGRTVYNPIFSGVLWNAQDVMVEDIERIEVIRGPGASLWGANAVNGVINIITKPASETQGGLVSVGVGTEQRRGAVRQGVALDDETWLRVYGVHRGVDDGWLGSGDGQDDFLTSNRAGFRADWDASAVGQATVQGDIFVETVGDYLTYNRQTPPFDLMAVEETEIYGGNLLARWERELNGHGTLTVQGYYDLLALRSPITDVTVNTADLEARHSVRPLEGHHLVWGLGYRFVHTATEGSPSLGFDPADHNDHIFNAFVQDEITLLPDTLSLTLGTKLEYYSYTGWELQPTARLLWTPDERHSVWAAVSRAVRTPTIANRALSLTGTTPTDLGVPLTLRVSGRDDVDPEVLWAYEAGYRFRPTETISLDLAGFYNVYEDMVTYDVSAPFFGPGGLRAEGTVGNRLRGTTYGVELAAEWQPTDWMTLNGWLGVLHVDLDLDTAPGLTATNRSWGGTSPSIQGGLRWAASPHRDIEAGVVLRAADAIKSIGADGYVDMDMRLAWTPRDGVELAVVGRNLLTGGRVEFPAHGEVASETASDIGRTVFAGLTMRF